LSSNSMPIIGSPIIALPKKQKHFTAKCQIDCICP
jgi:hypothetical protein